MRERLVVHVHRTGHAEQAHQQRQQEQGQQDRDVCSEVKAQGLEAGQVQEHRAAQPAYVDGREVDVAAAGSWTVSELRSALMRSCAHALTLEVDTAPG